LFNQVIEGSTKLTAKSHKNKKMVLIMMCGIPSSGKSKRAKEIYEHFTTCGQKVHLVCDDDLIEDKNQAYKDKDSEKQIRGRVKAAVERVLTKDNVVICDSSNYIKGYRYELYCVSRAQRTPSCVVFCDVEEETAKEWNTVWDNQLLHELSIRMEDPNDKNRWDKPLYSLKPNDPTPLKAIETAMLNPQHQPKPNLSTLPLQLSDTTLLYELDKTTNAIITQLMTQKSFMMPGEYITVPDTTEKLRMPQVVSMPELRKLRSQYVRVTQMHPPTSKSEIAKGFVMFLNLHTK
jgi:protein KTI12